MEVLEVMVEDVSEGAAHQVVDERLHDG